MFYKYKRFCRLWTDFNTSSYGMLAFQFEHFSEEKALSIIKTIDIIFFPKN